VKKFDIMELTIEKLHSALESGELNVKTLVKTYLERIHSFDQKGPKLNSIICLNDDVIKEAEALDNYYKIHGLKGPLHGVVILLKDNVHTLDMPTTAGSKSLKGFMANEDAFIVKKMKEAGALIIAKTNLHEFAIWGETISSIQGQTLNPYDLSRTPGGSSGGTGASVAANFGLIGIGTDTINSIRSPASANSLVGIRPTTGLVSKSGVVPYSNTQDVIGPIARTVEDATKLLDVICGYDKNDSKTAWSVGRVSQSYLNYLKEDGLKNKRIGILKDFFGQDKIHETTNREVYKAIDILEKNGAETISLDGCFDSSDMVQNVSVHLYDLKDHLNAYLESRPKSVPVHSMEEILNSGKYHESIKENLERANQLSTTTADYKERLIKKMTIQNKLMQLMAIHELDAIVYPHQKQLVCKVGGSQNERNGVLASVTGFPSICVPAGFSDPSDDAKVGVPIGMEILGRPFSENVLIEIAYAFEKCSNVRKVPYSVRKVPYSVSQ
jgi:Asp-tRNA(Asn)/Glu-tRNA(Gln) amidotransferase A subunit family amidase